MKCATLIELGAEVSDVGKSDALQPRHPSRMRPRRASASRFLADQEKSVAFGTGSWTDTPPLKGRCAVSLVAVWGTIEKSAAYEI